MQSAASNNSKVSARNILAELKAIGGLLFFKDFSRQSYLNADFASSLTGTYTCGRSSSYPSTYADKDGKIITTITSDVPRWQGGHYTENGFQLYSGLMVEYSSTNKITKSNNFEDAIFTKTNITATNTDAGSSSPDGTATAPSLTATGANGTLLLATPVTAQTFSIFLKRKTGTGKIYITANGGSTYAEVVVFSDRWARFNIIAASASQACGLKIETSGDAVYCFGAQFEAQFYMTSYIPTTSSALQRNAEKISFPISGNRNGAAEAIIMGVVKPNSMAGSGAQAIGNTDTKDRQIYYYNGHMGVYPNKTDSSGVFDTENAAGATGENQMPVVYGFNMKHSSRYVECYHNGCRFNNYTTPDWTTPAWGTNFYFGSNGHLGVLRYIAIFSTALSDAQMRNASEILMGNMAQLLSVGDSITYARAPEDFSAFNSKLNIVGDLINPEGSGALAWRTSGVSGNLINDVIARIASSLASFSSLTNKRIIFLQIGTNDITTGVSNDVIWGRMLTLLNLIYASVPDARVYVGLLTPRNDAYDGATTLYNAYLATQITAYKVTHPAIFAVDLNTPLKADPSWVADYMTDNLHPNATGRALEAATYKAAMIANGDY